MSTTERHRLVPLLVGGVAGLVNVLTGDGSLLTMPIMKLVRGLVIKRQLG